MKKILLLVILSISAFAANAGGVRSLDMKANLRHDFGLGLGVTFELPKNFEIAPSLNFYFNDGNMLTTDLDFRYRFELPKNFSLYPVLGLVYFHAHDYNHIGMNIGAGFGYDINSHWAVGMELKYQYVDEWDDAYFSLCAAYKF